MIHACVHHAGEKENEYLREKKKKTKLIRFGGGGHEKVK